MLTIDEIAGRRVLEVGSYDTTGSVRPGIESRRPALYLGVDIEPGPSVDQLCNVYDLERSLGAETFDVVISTEMVEHVRDWRRAFMNMKSVLRPGGVLVVTTRSRGFPYHFGPEDWWRYEAEDMAAIASDMDVISIEPDRGAPGIFLAARKTDSPAADLSRISLFSMVLHRRAIDVSDREYRVFRFTDARQIAHRLPGPIRRLGKRILSLMPDVFHD